jgi:hypothetical protein
LREERRRFRDPRRASRNREYCFGGNRCAEELQRAGRAGGQRRERIAQAGSLRLLLLVMAVGEVDEAAAAVGVLERVDERALPRREQRGGEDEPREKARQESATWQARPR